MVAESALATREASGQVAVSETRSILELSQLQQLIDALVKRGFGVFGPAAHDGAIVYDRIEAVDDLPAGWGDEQAPGRYRLKPRDDEALFGYVIGPQSWKKYLHPPEVCLWSAQRHGTTFRILNNEEKPPEPRALLGVRPCELAAIAVQDRVLVEDRYRDPIYGARRSSAFLIAVECTQSAATCFCASMGTGPAVASAHAADLVLTELLGPDGHRFLVRAGTERGAELLAEISTTPATKADLQQAETAVRRAADSQSRNIERDGLRDLLYQNFEHPRWENVAARCLMCANCTMVCPT